MQKKIIELIEKYASKNDFTGGIKNQTLIEDSEKKLELNIPAQYRWFLEMYGGGSLGSFEVLGLMSKINAVTETIKARKQGLPEGIIVIHNSDEWYDCIDVSTGNVVTWSRFDEEGILFAYEDFNHYVLDYIQDAIDNL